MTTQTLEEVESQCVRQKTVVDSKHKQLVALESDLANQASEAEAIRKHLKELQEQQTHAQQEFNESQKIRNELQPAWDRARGNWDQKQRSVVLKDAVAQEETLLKQNEELTKELELQLGDVSVKYKMERERRLKFRRQCVDILDATQHATEDKNERTLAIDAEEGAPNPFDIIDVAEEIIREREREIRNAVRHLRELEHTLQMKKEMEREPIISTLKTLETFTGAYVSKSLRQP